jgi:hypothetical protein
MATQTLELYDGVTTLDLIDESNYATQYTPGLGIPRAPHVPTISGDTLSAIEFKPRTISMVVDVLGTTQADMTINIAALERMLTTAQQRQITQQGTKVVLIVQQGTAAANDVSYTVLNGSLSLDESVLRGVSIAGLRTRATLTLLVEPFGKLPAVTLATQTLFNEIDGPNLNYIDINESWDSFYTFDGSATLIDCASDASIDNIWDGGGYFRMRFRIADLAGNDVIFNKSDVWYTWVNSSGEFVFNCGFTGGGGRWQSTDAGIVADQIYMIEVDYNSSSVANVPTVKLDGRTLTMPQVYAPVTARNSDAAGTLEIGFLPASNRLGGDLWEGALFDASGISASILVPLVGDEDDLVALWKFDDRTGTSLGDSSSNSNTGTITAGAGDWGVGGGALLPISGNAGGLLQVRIEDETSDPWVGSKTTYLATRSGARRADALFDAIPNAATHVDADILSGSPPAGNETSAGGTAGGPTANASGGASAYFRTTATADDGILQTGFLIRGYFDYQFTTLPKGLFRVLARCQAIHVGSVAGVTIANSGFGFALGYNFGGITSTPAAANSVAISAFSQWELLDLGEINIAPIATPTGFTDPTLSIRVNACLNHSGTSAFSDTDYIEWSCDFLFLLPIDEQSVIASSVSKDDELLADLISDPPGVWLLNTSSVPKSFASFNGSPIRLSPEATRLYWIRDEVLDASTCKANIYVKYVPLVSGI